MDGEESEHRKERKGNIIKRENMYKDEKKGGSKGAVKLSLPASRFLSKRKKTKRSVVFCSVQLRVYYKYRIYCVYRAGRE